MSKLFQEFQPVSTEDWLKIIKKDLKGGDIKKLMRKTIDGLVFEPFYRKENTENLATINSMPNSFPFLRGYKPNNNWEIRQDFLYEDAKKATENIKTVENSKLKLVAFNFAKKYNLSDEEFANLMDKVSSVAFEAHEEIEKVFFQLEKQKDNSKNVFINFDPFTYYTFTGSFYKPQDEMFDVIGKLLSNKNKNIKPVGINLHHYSNAGATPVMQLAFGLSLAAEYFDFAIQKGIKLEDILPNIYFNMSFSCEYFMDISKVRAFRYLYSKLVEAYNKDLKEQATTYIHGRTLRRNKSVYDAYVNMLRTTVETFAGVVGGVDSFTTEPFDTVFATPDEFSHRIAVNQQILIKEEAYADKVIDPAGGSYYVENLSVKLIEEAWKLFLEIQDKGGFCKAVQTNFISELVEKVAEKEINLVNKGRIAILGTNKYPNNTENLSDLSVKKPVELSDIKHKNDDFKPLQIGRLAENFESLRLKTEKSDKQAKVFLLTYGHKAMRRARADFAGNFFAVSGFKIIDNVGFETGEAGANEALKQDADIVVLCSSDDAYLELAKEVKGLLKDKIIVVAGNPESRPEIESLGVKNFVNVKSDLYQELVEYQNLLKL